MVSTGFGGEISVPPLIPPRKSIPGHHGALDSARWGDHSIPRKRTTDECPPGRLLRFIRLGGKSISLDPFSKTVDCEQILIVLLALRKPCKVVSGAVPPGGGEFCPEAGESRATGLDNLPKHGRTRIMTQYVVLEAHIERGTTHNLTDVQLIALREGSTSHIDYAIPARTFSPPTESRYL